MTRNNHDFIKAGIKSQISHSKMKEKMYELTDNVDGYLWEVQRQFNLNIQLADLTLRQIEGELHEAAHAAKKLI